MQLDGENGGRSAAMALALVFVHSDPALLGDGCGVDAVHVFRALQQPFDGGVADEVGLGVDKRSAVDEMDGVDPAFARLSEERAETTGWFVCPRGLTKRKP